jgi:coproporphyrinogen III oxidase-like Fe-S oxidoreductase
MKTVRFILALAIIIPGLLCKAQTVKETSGNGTTGKVEAYYFHYSSRCVTCKTVETEAKNNIETLYPEQVKQGLLSFQAINLDDASSKEIAKKLEVSGQSLLIVKGEDKFNITNEGFLYARSNPEKFKSIMKEKIDKLL